LLIRVSPEVREQVLESIATPIDKVCILTIVGGAVMPICSVFPERDRPFLAVGGGGECQMENAFKNLCWCLNEV